MSIGDLVLATVLTRLTPSANVKLQETEMRPQYTTSDRTGRPLSFSRP
jgi:hypothetical protein